jgi:hypothetical protein
MIPQSSEECCLLLIDKTRIKTRPIYECRCDERLKTKAEESTRLAYTGLLVELEHLKIKTTFIVEMFASVMESRFWFPGEIQ